MEITFFELLKNELFEDYKVIAGGDGLNRTVNRISVFDCPCHPEILARGIMEDGDVFISCLEQFEHDQDSIMIFLKYLLQYNCSGILVVATGRTDYMTEEAIRFCDENRLPVVFMSKNVSYATLISTINKYLEVENLNELNRLKIEKILSHDITVDEQLKLLLSINPKTDEYIQAIFVKGNFRSKFTSAELWHIYQNRIKDCVILEEQIIFIISENSEKTLKNKEEVLHHEICQHFKQYHAGYSRVGKRREIHRILDEGQKALDTALVLKKKDYFYDPLQVTQFLLSVRDSEDLESFYEAYCKRIAEYMPADSVKDMVRTIEVFVEQGGDFKKTALLMGQHINTIRYRVKRVREALGMDEDVIRFYQTISIATNYHSIQ